MELKQILVPIDFSDVTGAVLSVAARMARAFDARLCILHTESPPASALGYGLDPNLMAIGSASGEAEAMKRQFEEDRKALAVLQEQIAGGGVEAETRLLEGPTADTILRVAKETEADLIVMGSHTHGALYHLLVGSVRESILSEADVPVLVVPERCTVSDGDGEKDAS